MKVTPQERKDLQALSEIHQASSQVPCLVLEREDGKGHYAFLWDDLQNRLQRKRNQGKINGRKTQKPPLCV